MYTVDLRSDTRRTGVDSRALRRLAGRALEEEGVTVPAELSVLLTGDTAIRALNGAYRDTDAATDVLSFALAEGGDFARPDGAVPHLGDVIISIETARRQADERGIALADEVAHLLVHGLLHLLGYDHERPADARRMRAREEAILGTARHHDDVRDRRS